MDSSNTRISKPSSTSKRLFFDRRYGWVFDEWKEPSEEALAGGRGMFCILPLGKELLKTTTQSINHAATAATAVFERPELFSPQGLQSSIKDQFHKLMSSIPRPKSQNNAFLNQGNSQSNATSFSSDVQIGSRGS